MIVKKSCENDITTAAENLLRMLNFFKECVCVRYENVVMHIVVHSYCLQFDAKQFPKLSDFPTNFSDFPTVEFLKENIFCSFALRYHKTTKIIYSKLTPIYILFRGLNRTIQYH